MSVKYCLKGCSLNQADSGVSVSQRGGSHIWQWHFLGELKLNTVRRFECLVAQVSQAEQPEWSSLLSFRSVGCADGSSLWTLVSAATAGCPLWRGLSSSSLWRKGEHVTTQGWLSCNRETPKRHFLISKKLWVRVHVPAPLWCLTGGVSEPGCWTRSQHPGSSLILPRLMFHLFQLTSSTLRQQEDTCSNYCLPCDASISCQRRQISEEHSALRINRCCSHSCVFH